MTKFSKEVWEKDGAWHAAVTADYEVEKKTDEMYSYKRATTTTMRQFRNESAAQVWADHTLEASKKEMGRGRLELPSQGLKAPSSSN